MKADDAAVAGFFEDLPVLMFVLAGVLVLLLSGAWASSNVLQQREATDLERLAETLKELVLKRIQGSDLATTLPMMSSAEAVNLKEAVGVGVGALGYSIALVERYPDARWIKTESSGSPDAAEVTGSACALFNARDDSGRVVVLEVRVLVWQA